MPRRSLMYVGALAAIYALIVLYTGVETANEEFRAIGPLGWTVLLALSLANYVIRALRWNAFVALLGCHVKAVYQGLVYVAGFAFTATPGKAGEAVRLLYLKPYGVAYAHGAAALFSERALDLLSIGLIALPIVYWMPQLGWVLGLVFVATLCAIGSASHGLVHRLLGRLAATTSKARVSAVIRGVSTSLQSMAEILKGRILVAGFLVGVIAWAAEAYGFFLIMDWLDYPLDFWLAISIYSTGILAGAISFLPGGLGTTEAAMIALLTYFGTPVAEATMATLICRIATLWFAIALGLVASTWLVVRRKHPLMEADA